MKPPIPNSYWVIPGRFLAGEHPQADVEPLLEAGINSFIDLTESGENEPYQELLPRGVEYHPRPLPDHSVPADPGVMRDILATLRQALQSNRRVYLHCRAGIGRTGITVGCFLSDAEVKRGTEDESAGSAALVALNQLWRQNARSRHWPQVPETPEQEDYVLRWQSQRATLPAAPVGWLTLRDRGRGALLGLAVGDALSVSTQGLRPGEFEPVTTLTGGGEFDLPTGAWTDDTAMALCVAESLLECAGFDGRDQMSRYRRWQQEGYLSATGVAIGMRPAVRRALALAAWSRAPILGSHDPAQLDKEPLVRCAPPALYYNARLEAAIAAGADTARVTHQAPIVVDCCRLFTGMVQTALAGLGKGAIVELWRGWPGVPLKDEVLEVAERWSRPEATARQPSGRGSILNTLDAVVSALVGSSDFSAGALRLVNLGGDSDVAAAAYGQLAGAHYGVAGIPQAWRALLVDRELIESLADRLAG